MKESDPTTTDSGIDLDKLAQKLDAILQGYDVHGDAMALIERLRTAEVVLEQQTKAVLWWKELAETFEGERDELLKEHIDLQIYPKDMIAQLEEQVRALTADKQAWMAENTDLLTQVRSLTAERDHLLRAGMAVETKIVENDEAFDAGYEAGIKSQTGASDPTILHLEEQVERLTEELKWEPLPTTKPSGHSTVLGVIRDENAELREQVERLTEALKEKNAQK